MEIEDSRGEVEVILDSDKEPRLKRERNYTLRVTVVTEYANISSITEFSKSSNTVTRSKLNSTLCLVLQVLSLRAILQVSLCHNYLCVIKSVIMTGAPTNLRVVCYNRSRVNLKWEHPTVGYRIPSFAYVVTISRTDPA